MGSEPRDEASARWPCTVLSEAHWVRVRGRVGVRVRVWARVRVRVRVGVRGRVRVRLQGVAHHLVQRF